MERLLLEVLRGHVFWRRNFHPRDPRLIDERDKHTEAFDDMSARLRDELPKILAELKRAAQLKDRMDRLHTVRNVVLHLDPSAPYRPYASRAGSSTRPTRPQRTCSPSP